MLGRRAAIAAVIAGATAFSGGVALAATHGSSHASKPATSAPQKAAPRKVTPHSGHNCPNMGNSGAMYSGGGAATAL